jgi:tRNA pseudouridine32 synthase / 23S rRNA pseudouridine746 synthase
MKPEPSPREGVNASRVRVRPGEPQTALRFLLARFPHVLDWAERLQAGNVLDAGLLPLRADSRCPTGSLLWYWRRPASEPRVPFELRLLHRCEHLVVVDKPPFLAVAPAGRHLMETVLVRLQQQLGLRDLAPLHRLDRDTAGVLAFAAQPATRGAYQALWRERRVHKVYEAIVPWRDLPFPFTARHRLEEPEGAGFHQMQVVPGEPNAETLIELQDRLDDGLTRLRLTPRTGRKHQLRAQLAALGIPIVNDRIYPELLPDAPDDFDRPLQLLARDLRFVDPLDGQERVFVSQRQLG